MNHTFSAMHLRPIESINGMHRDVEAGSEVGGVVEPLEGVRRVPQGEAEPEHGEQAREHRPYEHCDLEQRHTIYILEISKNALRSVMALNLRRGLD